MIHKRFLLHGVPGRGTELRLAIYHLTVFVYTGGPLPLLSLTESAVNCSRQRVLCKFCKLYHVSNCIPAKVAMATNLMVDSKSLTPTPHKWSIVTCTPSCTVFQLFVIYVIMGCPVWGLKMEVFSPSSPEMETLPTRPPKGTSLHKNASINAAYALVWSMVLAVSA